MEILQVGDRTVKITGTDISLKDTFECGQCFRWNEYKDGYVGVAKGKVLYAYQNSDGLFLENTDKEEVEKVWLDYFDLNTDYGEIIGKIPENDTYLRTAAECGKGIRILKQDPNETVISFIISANNNIKRIKGIIERFSEKYGEEIIWDGGIYHSFPSVEKLCGVKVEDVAFLHAGYRDKYLEDAFGKLNKIDFAKVAEEDLRKTLLSVKGVGPKVCDCILLFGFSKYDAFPKDIWIKRVLKEHYGENFDPASFGKYAGVYQQYMFHYARNIEE